MFWAFFYLEYIFSFCKEILVWVLHWYLVFFFSHQKMKYLTDSAKIRDTITIQPPNPTLLLTIKMKLMKLKTTKVVQKSL